MLRFDTPASFNVQLTGQAEQKLYLNIYFFSSFIDGRADPSHDGFIFPKFGAIIQSGVK